MPELFSKDLERLSIWERIGNGLDSSVKKCGGNLDEFVSLVLDFIKATPGAVAANEHLEDWLDETLSETNEHKAAIINTFGTKLNILLVYGRQKWNESKGY